MRKYNFSAVPVLLFLALTTELVGGVALAAGFCLQAVIPLLAGYIMAASIMIPLKQLREPANRGSAEITLSKNIALLGALLYFFAVEV